MKAFKLSDVFPVQRPRLTAIEETREHDFLVHFDFRGQLDVPVIRNSGAQATEGLANFTDSTRDFLEGGSIRRYEPPKVSDVIDDLKFSSRYGHFGKKGCSDWGRLAQDFCYAETDSEVERLSRFRKSVDYSLEVRLRVCHKISISFRFNFTLL